MSDKNKSANVYDDGNIPDVDLPNGEDSKVTDSAKIVEPLPESSRPRQDGPGGS